MSLAVRYVTLSHSASEMMHLQAAEENICPEIYCSLVLELAIREREALRQSLAEALAQVSRVG